MCCASTACSGHLAMACAHYNGTARVYCALRRPPGSRLRQSREWQRAADLSIETNVGIYSPYVCVTRTLVHLVDMHSIFEAHQIFTYCECRSGRQADDRLHGSTLSGKRARSSLVVFAAAHVVFFLLLLLLRMGRGGGEGGWGVYCHQ